MTSEHFAGKYEAELKFHLSDPAGFLERITLAGAEPFHLNNHEIDCYYDRPTSEHSDSTLKRAALACAFEKCSHQALSCGSLKGQTRLNAKRLILMIVKKWPAWWKSSVFDPVYVWKKPKYLFLRPLPHHLRSSSYSGLFCRNRHHDRR